MLNGSNQPTGQLDALLRQLDPDPDIAAGKYLRLRERLVRIAVWRGCPPSAADETADIVIDRIAAKISGGTEIENMGAFSVQVLKFVLLERQRKTREDAAGDDLPEIAVQPDIEVEGDEDERLDCLRRCLNEVARDDDERRLILAYYDLGDGGKIKEKRKRLAEDLGISSTNLKVRACRIRERLERCIRQCMTGNHAM